MSEREPDHVDPVATIVSALAHGQIGRTAWALLERGDGLILAIGDINIPIDTPAEGSAALQLANHLDERVFCWGVRRWPSKEL